MERFGLLVGTFDHIAVGSRYRTGPDDNHVYLWLRSSWSSRPSLYECAVTLASPSGSGIFAPILQCDRIELLGPNDLPCEGFHLEGSCSYGALGLQDADFQAADPESLAASVTRKAEAAALIAVYGVTYQNGEGLHDIHLNSHEIPGSLHRDRLDPNGVANQDGALVFIQKAEESISRADWLFLKFSTQRLTETVPEGKP